MSRTISLVHQVQVASPCPAKWDRMQGDQRVRFCGECRMNVYNFAEMTEAEIEHLLTNADGRVCGRFHRRADGTILTKDCPVGVSAARRRVRRMLAKVAAALTLLTGGFAWARAAGGGDPEFSSISDLPGLRTVKRWLDPAPPALPPGRFLAGDIAWPPAPPNATPGTAPKDCSGNDSG